MPHPQRATNTKLNTPIFVDVEASGFGSLSYPIEIGIALPDGNRYCTLIAPAPSWVHWDPKAEALHGLSRERLINIPIEYAKGSIITSEPLIPSIRSKDSKKN